MAQDKNVLSQAILSLEKGMAGSPDARLILPNQAALLINTTVRDGFPGPRPGYVQRALTYEDEDQAAIIEEGRYQGGTHFTPREGIPALYASFNGRQYRVNVWTDYSVQEVSAHFPGDPTDPINLDANSANNLETWWCATPDFLLMQDGESPVWCHDGMSSRRLGPYELPVGCMMEYALGRVWVVLPDRQTFVAGDLIGSASGTPQYQYRDALLKFTQNTGQFSVPASAGPINAVRYMPNLDTSLGQGPVQFFTDNGAFSVNAPFNSEEWSKVTYPIQTVSLGAPGALSQNSTVRVNSDIWYRGADGVRSFIVARRDFTMWGNVPMSDEVSRILAYDAPWLLSYSSAVLFDNRLLMTTNPRWKQGRGIIHDKLVVVNYELISSLSGRSNPCWEGIWTGRSILQLITGSWKKKERCWAWVFNNVEEKIELWELTKGTVNDHPANDQPQERIRWGGESRAYDYQTPGLLKTLENLDFQPTELQGTVDFSFKYRVDDAPCWTDWADVQLCATDRECPPEACWDPAAYRKSYRSRVTLPEPDSQTCNATSESPSHLGLRNQVRWEVLGQCKLKQMVVSSRVQQQAPFEGCSPEEAVCTEEQCCEEDNDFQGAV